MLHHKLFKVNHWPDPFCFQFAHIIVVCRVSCERDNLLSKYCKY